MRAIYRSAMIKNYRFVYTIVRDYFGRIFQASKQQHGIIHRAINRIPVHNRCGSNLGWRERVDRVT